MPNDRELKTMTLTRDEAAALLLGQAVLGAAMEALRTGRYRPSGEELRRISKAMVAASMAGAPAVLDSTIPDSVLDEAAWQTGHSVVESVLGPPPPEALN